VPRETTEPKVVLSLNDGARGDGSRARARGIVLGLHACATGRVGSRGGVLFVRVVGDGREVSEVSGVAGDSVCGVCA